ncbi:MAG TPA: nucleotide pyrophosphohydrolase, partial [Planctomycetaceae bacterium]|nr:nucleotide pyrophosphohydrolase [Planctomycetaceae bacterium]
MTTNDPADLSIADLQRHIRQMYYEKDVVRGVDGTFMWLME